MSKLVVWYNPNKKVYYHKIVKTSYADYKVGYKNNYDHEVILVVENIYTEQIVFKQYFSLRKMVLTPVIAFLQKLNRD